MIDGEIVEIMSVDETVVYIRAERTAERGVVAKRCVDPGVRIGIYDTARVEFRLEEIHLIEID